LNLGVAAVQHCVVAQSPEKFFFREAHLERLFADVEVGRAQGADDVGEGR